MPTYEFDIPCGQDPVSGNQIMERREIQCEADMVHKKTREIEALGGRRVFSRPNIVVYPGYNDAVNETLEMVEQEDRQRLVEQAEAADDLVRAVREEHGRDL